MNMMTMVIILTFIYFVSLILMCSFIDKINKILMNGAFLVAVALAYFCWNWATYSRGGLSSPMTFDNISPLTCVLVLLTPFMSEKVKDFAYSAISFLCFGMFVALMFSPSHTYLFNFNIEANFYYASEAMCHFCCSLFGIYLALSGQVKIDAKHLGKSVVCMYSLITFGVACNYLFHKSHFGMNPYGGYSIYMLDIFHNFEATILAYYLGVFLVLCLGFELVYLLYRFVLHKYTPPLFKAANIESEASKSATKTSSGEGDASASEADAGSEGHHVICDTGTTLEEKKPDCYANSASATKD